MVLELLPFKPAALPLAKLQLQGMHNPDLVAMSDFHLPSSTAQLV